MQASSLTHRPSAKRFCGSNKRVVTALVACGFTAISGYTGIQFLEQASAISTVHTIAGLAIVILVMPFLILTGMLSRSLIRSGHQAWPVSTFSLGEAKPVKITARRSVVN